MRDVFLGSPDATADLARRIGQRLSAGDVVLLEGDIGVGKTHFARSLIQSLMDPPEDVPSPTFTLVQSYDTARGEIWHADLYRLGSVHEIEELGLIDAFEDAICLVEWPDRLGEFEPRNALRLTFATTAEDKGRRVELSWTASRWTALVTDLAA